MVPFSHGKYVADHLGNQFVQFKGCSHLISLFVSPFLFFSFLMLYLFICNNIYDDDDDNNNI